MSRIRSNVMPDGIGFDERLDRLHDSFRSLWSIFVKNDQEPWTHLTMSLSSSGKLKIDYKCDDLSDHDPYADHIIWAYEVLDMKPHGDYGKQILEEYLKQKSQ